MWCRWRNHHHQVPYPMSGLAGLHIVEAWCTLHWCDTTVTKHNPTSYTGLVGHPLCLYFIDKTSSSIGPCFSLNNQSFDTSLQDSASVLHLTEGWCSTTFTFMKETPRVSPCYSLNNQSFDKPLQDSANHKGVLHVTEGWCDTPSTYTT